MSEASDAALVVLDWLVRLKDGPRDSVYREEKKSAWAAARTLLRDARAADAEEGA